MSARPAPRRLSTRGYLLALVAAVVVPLLAFATFLLLWYTAAERARLEREAVQVAQQIGAVIDAELGELVALLKGLSASEALLEGDLAAFHSAARRVVDGTDGIIVLRDIDGRQFVNTQLPRQASLPPAVPMSASERAAFESGRALISRVYRSPISGEARIAVAIPVSVKDDRNHVLAITVPTSRIRDTLIPAVPRGWVVGIGDESGTYVTRSQRHGDVTGTPGLPDYLEKAVGRSGTFTSSNFEGVRLFAGYYRSDFSNWLIGANIPQDAFEAPIWRSVAAFAALGTAALILSALMAYVFGATFAAATAGLAERAAALGQGLPVTPMDTRLADFAVVGDALAAAGASIHERSHELETVLATVPAAVLFTYRGDRRQIIANRYAAELLRVPRDDADTLTAQGTPLDHLRIAKDGRVLRGEELPLYRAMRGEQIEDEEYTCLFADGTNCTLLTSATALRDEFGAIVGAVSVSVDISERKRNEEQRRLLINELNHRVKNTLATVQSIAVQTLRGAPSMSHASNAVTDRLIALGHAHDVLTRESWEGADLKDIVTSAVRAHGGPERFLISGPAVWLPPSLSLSLSLALHELATNATRYGALSNETGRVDIFWMVDTGSPARLTLRWSERGGPPVRQPKTPGFGSVLIQRSLSAESGGSVSIEFAPEGLTCVMTAQIEQRRPQAAKAAS